MFLLLLLLLDFLNAYVLWKHLKKSDFAYRRSYYAPASSYASLFTLSPLHSSNKLQYKPQTTQIPPVIHSFHYFKVLYANICPLEQQQKLPDPAPYGMQLQMTALSAYELWLYSSERRQLSVGGHGTQTSSEFHAEVRGVNRVKDTKAGGGSITSPL